MNGFSIREENPSTSLEKDVAEILSTEYQFDSGSGEPALVEFVGNNDNTTLNHPVGEDHQHHGVRGFFKRLGCDLVKGTQIVTKGVKSGFDRVRNFFSRNKETPVEKEAEKEVENEKEVEITNPERVEISSTTTTTTEALPDENEISGDPQIDVRILGGRDPTLQPVLYNF